ncbi:hypothetical protein HDU85_005537 [Gaertneriomyces sp. JEL0708]|nr:hypothetical protein HDU85_005537 [Gaertneriomyces sp. JEL0708]
MPSLDGGSRDRLVRRRSLNETDSGWRIESVTPMEPSSRTNSQPNGLTIDIGSGDVEAGPSTEQYQIEGDGCPPSPHPSDYQFNPELDDNDDDLMEDSPDEDEDVVTKHARHRHRRPAEEADCPICQEQNPDMTRSAGVPLSRFDTMTSTITYRHLPLRARIWHIMHDKRFSWEGLILRRIFETCLVVSVITMCLGTVDIVLRDREALRAVYGVEAACLVVFSLKLLLYVASAPHIRYLMTFGCLLDFLCVLPFYVDIVRAVVHNTPLYEQAYSIETGAWVRLFDLFRVIRLFRVFPKTSKLRMMSTALVHSIDGLWLLFFTIPLILILFSTLLFYAEQSGGYWNDEDRQWYYHDGTRSPFQSIPTSFYLTMVTLTTVGYGDVTPMTTYGKLVCSGVMIVSLFVVAFPLSMITSQYALVADRYAQNRAQLRKERRERAERRRERRKRMQFLQRMGWNNVDGAAILANVKDKMINFVGMGKGDDGEKGLDAYGLAMRRAWTAPATDHATWVPNETTPRVNKTRGGSQAVASDVHATQPKSTELKGKHQLNADANASVDQSSTAEGLQKSLEIPHFNSILNRLGASPQGNSETFPRSMLRRTNSTPSMHQDLAVTFDLPSKARATRGTKTGPEDDKPETVPTGETSASSRHTHSQIEVPMPASLPADIPDSVSIELMRATEASISASPSSRILSLQISIKDEAHLNRVLAALAIMSEA